MAPQTAPSAAAPPQGNPNLMVSSRQSSSENHFMQAD